MYDDRKAPSPGAVLGLGIVMALLALVGLVMTSQARDDVFYGVGLGLFLFGVLFVFGLIGRHVGRPSEHRHQADLGNSGHVHADLAAGMRRGQRAA